MSSNGVRVELEKEEQRFKAWERFNSLLLTLKTEEEGQEPRNVVASGSWEQPLDNNQQEMGISGLQMQGT